MRALEAAAEAAGTSARQLMEEAGLAVAQESWMLLGTLEGRRIVALAGPGNNGGDAIVAARHLFDWGADVTIAIPRARRDTSLIDELEGREIGLLAGEDDPGSAKLRSLLGTCDLIIDGLLGTGQKRPLDPAEPVAKALELVQEARRKPMPPKLLAVDIPTGINADTGEADPRTAVPDLTVTFGLPKVGMYQGAASSMTGRVEVIDIGLPKDAQDALTLELLTARWARTRLPARPETANKGTFGRVLVLGGSTRYVGAPKLAAEAAYRVGAGLVTVACPAPVAALLAAAIPEATWLPQDTAPGGGLGGQSVLALRREWAAFAAAVVGPGMGLTVDTEALLWAVLPDIALDVPNGAVFDADALNVLAVMPDAPERLAANSVLTPHPGEMARLMGTTVAEVQARRMEAAQEAAAKYGCVVVLKGAHSVIAAPGGETALSPFANPLLATAGSGDVLAGVIGGLLAQGTAPFEAASLGVYLHGAAGESLRADYGDAGLLAGELAARLPRVVKELRGN